MMYRRRDKSIAWSLRLMAAGLGAMLLAISPVSGQSLIPADFFNAPLAPGQPANIEAGTLTLEGTGRVVATGNVVFTYAGYTARGQRLIYDRTTGAVRFDGPARIEDPSGNVIEGSDLAVAGGMRQGFIEALTITGYDGSRITAESVEYDAALRTILESAAYAPCGTCIDAEGRRIGWSVSATRIVQTASDGSVMLEQPTLELLGMPVAWLPYLWLPDLSGTALDNVRAPTIDYSNQIGVKLEVPYAAHSSQWTDIILYPTLVSRQGLLLGAEWVQRFEAGRFQIRASGLYQFDPNAFDFSEAQRDWRGAIQASGHFAPRENWTAGFSYTAFTDAAFLPDYRYPVGDWAINEVYSTYLAEQTYFDLRVQRFYRLGNHTTASQAEQALAAPNARFNQTLELPDGWGQVQIEARGLGVSREADQIVGPINGVTHASGFAGQKYHAMAQAAWETQFVGPGGVLLTPYAGVRLDATSWTSNSASALAPGSSALFSATPIAALDMRWPWLIEDGINSHVIEPIAQIVYRGGPSLPGLTNDDAQSFVFEDTNLFSYNRFTGADRQETGLRANVGAQYGVDFVDGSSLDLIAGQSFHLAGENAFTLSDPAMPGATEALMSPVSHAVFAGYARFNPQFRIAGKLLVDPQAARISRAGLGAEANVEGYSAILDYHYLAANPAAGVVLDQHEIGGEIGIPIMDYWRLTAGGYWDLSANSWLQASAGLRYDDSFLEFGAGATLTGPTHTSPNDTRFMATFRLKAPAGLNVGYGGGL